MHTAPYFTALALLAVANSVRTVRLRRANQVSIGDGGLIHLTHARVVTSNFTEYVPLGLVLLLALEFIQAPVWYLHLVGGTLLIGRMLHALAFAKETISMNARVGGMVLTYLSLLLGALGLTLFSMMELRG